MRYICTVVHINIYNIHCIYNIYIKYELYIYCICELNVYCVNLKLFHK